MRKSGKPDLRRGVSNHAAIALTKTAACGGHA
jgi:hypothetical protein